MTEAPADRGRPIPGIEAWERPVVVLNPVPGAPTAADSHLGGPLLWPADEPWPWCESGHSGYVQVQDCENDRVPHFAAAQFYRRDFPELPFPDGTDLLQVLFCPLYHRANGGPGVRLHWRASGSVGAVLTDVPAPALREPEFFPRPMVFEPERTTEYPAPDELPEEMVATFSFLQDPDDHDDHDEWPDLARGSKIGGWTAWYHTERPEGRCSECGAPVPQGLALSSSERKPGEKAGWLFGDHGSLNVFLCSNDPRHPFTVEVD
ncbi:hypothetical protein [Lentzea sp. NBRC 102530]|uniref:hypothetical protein n=1 Tax=Lentzea sp. NBRC 102530 TaxID=3032201 RepID=UPI0024A4DCB5|nr:hypothetical protein [Lentzea sp. NBRC 102530]GLY51202.1 hypothetical protein Lesp01_48580 [Lentzea sp. NBRC 102530]